MLIMESDLKQITADVFRSITNLELTATNPRVHLARELVAASVVEGSWYNRLEIFADDRAISAISQSMPALQRPSPQQVRVLFWEVCNILGRIIESSYPKQAVNGLPVIGRGYGGLNRLPHQTLRATFDFCRYPITVTLLDM